MKCKDFEFECIVAPNEMSGEACEHLKTCLACQVFAKQQAGFDNMLASVIKCEVPSDLRDSLREHRVESMSPWKLPGLSIALAASLMLAVGMVALNTSETTSSVVRVDRLLVEHFEHDGAHSMTASAPISPLQLAQLGESFGVRVTLANTVSFVEKCPIGDSYGLHLVYQHNNQPITLIYMPDIALDETVSFYYAGLKGWVKPMQKGSLAILGGSTAELPKQEKANDMIEWL
mgnify:CR=1 FL=1